MIHKKLLNLKKDNGNKKIVTEENNNRAQGTVR